MLYKIMFCVKYLPECVLIKIYVVSGKLPLKKMVWLTRIRKNPICLYVEKWIYSAEISWKKCGDNCVKHFYRTNIREDCRNKNYSICMNMIIIKVLYWLILGTRNCVHVTNVKENV